MRKWTMIWISLEKPPSHPIRANTQSESDTNRRFLAIRLSYLVQSVAYSVQIHPDPRDRSEWGETSRASRWLLTCQNAPTLSFHEPTETIKIFSATKRHPSGEKDTKQKQESVWREINQVYGLRYVMIPKSDCPGPFDSFQHFPAFISNYWWNLLLLWRIRVIREGQENR